MPSGRRRPAPLTAFPPPTPAVARARPPRSGAAPPSAPRQGGAGAAPRHHTAPPPHGPAARHKVCTVQPGAAAPLPFSPAGAAATSSSSERRREPRAQPQPCRAGAAALPARSSGTAQRRIALPAGQGGKSPTHCTPRPRPLPRPSYPVLPPSSLIIQTGRSGRHFGDLCGLSGGAR